MENICDSVGRIFPNYSKEELAVYLSVLKIDSEKYFIKIGEKTYSARIFGQENTPFYGLQIVNESIKFPGYHYDELEGIRLNYGRNNIPEIFGEVWGTFQGKENIVSRFELRPKTK